MDKAAASFQALRPPKYVAVPFGDHEGRDEPLMVHQAHDNKKRCYGTSLRNILLTLAAAALLHIGFSGKLCDSMKHHVTTADSRDSYAPPAGPSTNHNKISPHTVHLVPSDSLDDPTTRSNKSVNWFKKAMKALDDLLESSDDSDDSDDSSDESSDSKDGESSDSKDGESSDDSSSDSEDGESSDDSSSDSKDDSSSDSNDSKSSSKDDESDESADSKDDARDDSSDGENISSSDYAPLNNVEPLN